MTPHTTPMIRVLIADDHKLLSETVQLYLQAEDAFEVDRTETLEGALSAIAVSGAYDIVLLDLDMPGMAGLQGLERAIAANDGGRVVLFSGQARHEAALRALELGAAGYIPKTLSPRSLAAALRFVAAGEIYFPSAIAMPVARADAVADGQLSQRERQVLRGICEGATNRDIANSLSLTEVTIKMYVRSVCSKLNAANRTQAAIIALSSGIV